MGGVVERLNRVVGLFAVIILLSGCATPTFHRLDQSARQHFQSVDSFLVFPQDEISVQVDSSNIATATGGGVIPALIDAAIESSRAETAEGLIQPVRNNLIDFNYPEILASELNTAFNELSWLNAGNVELKLSEEEKQLDELYSESNGSAIVYMTADYSLSPEFHAVTTRINLAIYPKSEALMPFRESNDSNKTPTNDGDNIYRQVFEYSTLLIGDPDLPKEASVAVLAENNSTALMDALRKNAEVIAGMIRNDIVIDKEVAKK